MCMTVRYVPSILVNFPFISCSLTMFQRAWICDLDMAVARVEPLTVHFSIMADDLVQMGHHILYDQMFFSCM